MALQFDRVREVCDAVTTISTQVGELLNDLRRVLDFNSAQAITWTLPAKTFTAANATNVFTSTAHGFAADQKVRVSNAGGALPAGLSAGTDYFVIAANLAANTFQLSATKGGAAADVTTDGTGTQTAEPVPDYLSLETNGNLSGRLYTPAEASNAVGSLAQMRNLLTNVAPTQGDHIGSLNKLARPL